MARLPVVGYEGLYEVSDTGDVYSLDRLVSHGQHGAMRTLKGRRLKPYGDRCQVNLSKEGKVRPRRVGPLVLTAFVGPRPEGLECCHRDDDTWHNDLSNLRWDTQSANMHDRVRNGIHHMSRRATCSRGHQYTEENTRRVGTTRFCRRCAKDDRKRTAASHAVYKRAWRERRRAAGMRAS